MKKREMWLRLFEKNPVALACAIHLCERYVDNDQLIKNKTFITEKVKQLNDEIPSEDVEKIFRKN